MSCSESAIKSTSMETTAQYATLLRSGEDGAIVRVAIYARLSRDPSGLSPNTAIQVAECLAEARRYALNRRQRVKVVVIFEENDVSASEYSKKERLDFQRLIELIQQNKVDAIFVTEVERLVRQPAE